MERKLPWYLEGFHFIIGAEEEPGALPVDSGGDDPDEDERTPENNPGDDQAELKRALVAERRARKAAEKTANTLSKEKQEAEEAEAGELSATRAKLQRAEARTTKLSEGFVKVNIDSAILNAAAKASFIDTNDALAGVDRSTISYTQDDDNPAEVVVDQASVKKAVERLAAKKPHWIAEDDSISPSASHTFGRAGNRRGREKATAEELQQKYPSL